MGVPTPTRTRERSNTHKSYNTYYDRALSGKGVYANTSSAYEIPSAYPERSVRKTPAPSQGKKTQTKTGRVTVRAFAFIVVLVALCCSVIYRQTVILENNQEIKKLQKEYAAVLASNQAMQAKIDMWLETGEVEKYAKEELGMIKPQTNQTFYIDMHLEDMSGEGSVSASAASAVSGIQGSLVNAFRVLK